MSAVTSAGGRQCQINGGVSQIDARVLCAGFGKLGAVSPESTTHFQHGEIFCVCKSCRCGNVPLLFISMLFDEFVKPARSGRRVGKLRPAGILLPERTYTFL